MIKLRFETDTRYYSLRIEEDLFGFWLIVRAWGGLSSRRGREMKESFSTYNEASKRLEKLIKLREKNGYMQIFP